MTAVLEFVDAAAGVLAGHASYTWNKSATRIRCNGAGCGAILDAPNGADEAITVFARHQAVQLPLPAAPEPLVIPASVPEPETSSAEVAPVAEPELHSEQEPESPDLHLEPEPAPTGEPMDTAVTETSAPKIRRDTKALTATIAEIKKGDRVSAGFNHPRYGWFTVEGTVVKGGTGLDRNQLIVGGWYINLNERAAKYLHELSIIAPAGKHEFVIPKPSELTEHVGIGS